MTLLIKLPDLKCMRERLWLTTRRSAQFGGGRKNEVAADCAIQVCRYFEDIFTAAAREVHTVSGLVAVQGFILYIFLPLRFRLHHREKFSKGWK